MARSIHSSHPLKERTNGTPLRNPCPDVSDNSAGSTLRIHQRPPRERQPQWGFRNGCRTYPRTDPVDRGAGQAGERNDTAVAYTGPRGSRNQGRDRNRVVRIRPMGRDELAASPQPSNRPLQYWRYTAKQTLDLS